MFWLNCLKNMPLIFLSSLLYRVVENHSYQTDNNSIFNKDFSENDIWQTQDIDIFD